MLTHHQWRPEPAFLHGLLMRWRGVLPGHDDLFEVLARRWSEPHRKYHTLRHLHEMLAALDTLDAGPAERLAAWYHDAVYDFEPGIDETRSAALAVEELGAAGLAADQVAEVERLVLLTMSHAPARGDDTGARLSDADLAVLGAADVRFEESCREIRTEYAHVGDRDFRRSRTAVLEDFLARPSIYHTAQGHQLWQVRAVANIRGELARLA